MNIKELLFIAGFALVISWGIDYLFLGRYRTGADSSEVKSGQSFTAPRSKQEIKPLNLEMDFVDTKRPAPTVKTAVETDETLMVFTSDGAALERMEFKRELGGKPSIITTIFPAVSTERENKCFLVALDEKTPYFYELVSRQDHDDTVDLVYEAKTDVAVVQKRFTIFKHSYKVNLGLKVVPRKGENNPVEARILFPAPVMPEIEKNDMKSAIVSTESGSITKIARTKASNQGWFMPSFFGVDNRYFVHALLDDPQQFTKRAYCKVVGQSGLQAILEGPTVSQETEWTMSFYFGPKEISAMAKVDDRLEQTLDYAGLFSFISKAMLKLLDFLYKYLHNYGLAIIVLTLFVKLVLLPFSLKGEQSMKKSTDFKKKLAYLQQRYKDDPERLAQERAELIRKHGMPGMSGCLPLLLQFPIFIGLNRVLSSSIEFYKAPLGLWISDLSAPDPYYILPVIIFLTMILQASSAAANQRMAMIGMGLLFGVISASLSAGLALYICVNTLFTIAQTMLLKKYKAA